VITGPIWSALSAVPIWASDHMLSGYGGRCDHPMPGGSNAIVWNPGQMRKQAVPQAHLTPDTGVEQQRLALPVDLGVDPQSPDA
jgi:hypothetical protein